MTAQKHTPEEISAELKRAHKAWLDSERVRNAAPEMLEALKAIGAPDLVDLVPLPDPVIRGMLNAAVSVAQDAIAKAEGHSYG